MGDMAEVFNAMKQHKKQTRKSRLENADSAGWSKHSEHHWFMNFSEGKINYWPSSGLVMIGSKRFSINSDSANKLISKAITEKAN